MIQVSQQNNLNSIKIVVGVLKTTKVQHEGKCSHPSSFAALLRLLRFGSPERRLDAAQHLGVNQSSHKDHERA